MVSKLSWNCVSQNSFPCIVLGCYGHKRCFAKIWKVGVKHLFFLCSEDQGRGSELLQLRLLCCFTWLMESSWAHSSSRSSQISSFSFHDPWARRVFTSDKGAYCSWKSFSHGSWRLEAGGVGGTSVGSSLSWRILAGTRRLLLVLALSHFMSIFPS